MNNNSKREQKSFKEAEEWPVLGFFKYVHFYIHAQHLIGSIKKKKKDIFKKKSVRGF